TTDETANYVVIVVTSIEQNKTPEWLQFEENNEVTRYEDPYVIPSKLLQSDTYSKNNNFVISGDLETKYEVMTPSPTINTSLNLSVVYGWFDDLVSSYPEYITRSLLANESSGLPIYSYTFNPPKTGEFPEALPKVLHLSGIHGDEKEAIASTM